MFDIRDTLQIKFRYSNVSNNKMAKDFCTVDFIRDMLFGCTSIVKYVFELSAY